MTHEYIQNNYFHGQLVEQKMFLFKMSFYGPAGGVDLVRGMQANGDL